MVDRYHTVIVGAGPGGLSAAGRAASRDREAGVATPSYLLIEGSAKPADTIQKYQKGKHVMAEPGYLDLRSDMPFEMGTREAILDAWSHRLDHLDVHIRYESSLINIEGSEGNFTLSFNDGSRLAADYVVLAIGVQGNPRLLGRPGTDDVRVFYQLDDPDAYGDEHIMVVGAGDAAIENALALAKNNRVTLLNRGTEFSRAKDSNLQLILAAINDPDTPLDCFYGATVDRVENDPSTPVDDPTAMAVFINTPEGEVRLDCHRILARLGSTPPRAFFEKIGVELSGQHAEALPELDHHYRTNIPGLHVIGALAGNPLIKQAMNQGYDVVEFINGNEVQPADHALLELRFAGLPFRLSVDEQVDRLKQLIPMFAELNTLQFRELLIESDILASYPPGAALKDAQRQLDAYAASLKDPTNATRLTRLLKEDDVIHEAGQYGTTFYTILAGEVLTERTLDDGRRVETRLKRGEFFGEVGLLSGHPRQERAIAGQGCIVIETPRRTLLKLIASNQEVKSGIDWVFTVRELQRHLAPLASKRDLREIASAVSTRQLKAGETLYSQGDEERCLYLIKSGGFTLTRTVDGVDQFVAQVRAGRMLGQLGLMGDRIRRDSAVATVVSEAVEIDQQAFNALMALPHAPVASLQQDASRLLAEHSKMEVRKEAGSAMDFLMAHGLGEATNTLIIDESLCIGCDNCEKACAETHGGVSQLDRRLGPTFANIHIPTACRHCQQPHCMKDCPPNALHRAKDGEVFIDETCIGCGNCQTNCPYGVIRMVAKPERRPGLLGWTLFGRGQGPGEVSSAGKTTKDDGSPKKAMKCDACVHLPRGPACVGACPTGAALRLAPIDYVRLVEEKARH